MQQSPSLTVSLSPSRYSLGLAESKRKRRRPALRLSNFDRQSLILQEIEQQLALTPRRNSTAKLLSNLQILKKAALPPTELSFGKRSDKDCSESKASGESSQQRTKRDIGSLKIVKLDYDKGRTSLLAADSCSSKVQQIQASKSTTPVKQKSRSQLKRSLEHCPFCNCRTGGQPSAVLRCLHIAHRRCLQRTRNAKCGLCSGKN